MEHHHRSKDYIPSIYQVQLKVLSGIAKFDPPINIIVSEDDK